MVQPGFYLYLHMIRFTCLGLILALFSLTSCDDRTQEARRWDAIAKNLQSGVAVQPWREAAHPWGSENYRTGIAW
jgi:hypothetical protein